MIWLHNILSKKKTGSDLSNSSILKTRKEEKDKKYPFFVLQYYNKKQAKTLKKISKNEKKI